MPEFTVGAPVYFVPGPEHAQLIGLDGEMQYAFHFVKDVSNGERAGARANHKKHGKFRRHGGELVAGNGQAIKLGEPISRWPAWIAGVNPDGSVDIAAIDPSSFHPSEAATFAADRPAMIHLIPDRHHVRYQDDAGKPVEPYKPHLNVKGVPFDASGKTPHSFHLREAK